MLKAYILIIGIILMSGSVFRFGTPLETGLFHQHYFENGANSKSGDIMVHIHFNLSDADPQPTQTRDNSVYAVVFFRPILNTGSLPEQPGISIYRPPKTQI